jgi:hypothetical protein
MRWRRRWRRLSAYVPLMLIAVVVIILLVLSFYLRVTPRPRGSFSRVFRPFQVPRERFTIGSMNIERRVKKARRKEKAEAKRARREARRQQKAGAGSVKL